MIYLKNGKRLHTSGIERNLFEYGIRIKMAKNISIRKNGVMSVRKGRMTIAGRYWLTTFYALVPLIFISSNICYAYVYSK